VIDRFLQDWLGRWPAGSPRDVVVSPLRAEPGWDGQVRPVQGVAGSDGRWVVSVAPERAALDDPLAGIGLFEGVFRFTEAPSDVEPAGRWVAATDPVVPDWLHPFDHEVLVELDDDGRYLAGVGIKRHLPTGWELSVGTDERARGRGLARRLVATAARFALDHGAVPIYLHADSNVASAKAAEAAGLPDRGWRVLSVAGPNGEA
jgi:GNAT superfamily N-acetyltransferase